MFIIVGLWLAISTFIMIQYYPMCVGLTFFEKIMVSIIFLLGGPFFLVATLCETFLSLILPEGWDNDDGPKQM